MRRLRGEAGRARGQAAPLLRPRLHARVGVHAARAAAGRRARGRARAAGRSAASQCEGVYRKLKDRQVSCGINGCKHKWTWTRRRADPGLRHRPPQRAAAPDVRGVQGRLRRDRRPRGPLPHLGLQEDLDLVARRSARRLPRRQAGAQGAAPDVRELPRHLPGAQGRGAPLPPHRLQADLDRQARRPAGARRARQDRRSLSAVLRDLREGDGRARGSPDRLQDRELQGTWTWTKRAAAGGRRAARSPRTTRTTERRTAGNGSQTDRRREGAPTRAAVEQRAPTRRAAADGRRGIGRRNAEAPASAAASRAERRRAAAGGKRGRNKKKRRREIRPPERRCQACIDFLKDRKTMEIPCKTLRDADLLAAREPAADPPRRLGRAGDVRRLQARRDRGRARHRARGAARRRTAAQPGAAHAEPARRAAPDAAAQPRRVRARVASSARTADARTRALALHAPDAVGPTSLACRSSPPHAAPTARHIAQAQRGIPPCQQGRGRGRSAHKQMTVERRRGRKAARCNRSPPQAGANRRTATLGLGISAGDLRLPIRPCRSAGRASARASG